MVKMKPVQFTLTITGRVADDISLDDLFLNLNLAEVQVSHLNYVYETSFVEAKLDDYETINVEALDEPEFLDAEEMPLDVTLEDADHLPEDDLPRDTVPYSDEGP